MALIEAVKISKTYTDMAEPVRVLHDLDFSFCRSDLVGIFGASGSGKSTLLHILGGIDLPDSGKIIWNGRNLIDMKSAELAHYRNMHVGFVFQFYHLLAEFTALENTMLPALIAGMNRTDAGKAAGRILEAMGLGSRMNHRPAMLSGGEQQRVAIARAAVQSPPMIFADEPTGNLDHETGDQIFKYLLRLNEELGIAIVIVTHNRDMLGKMPRACELSDGRLIVLKEKERC